MLCFVFNSLRKYVFVRFLDISVNVEEEFEDTKVVIRTVYRRRTDNTITKRTNNDLQKIHIKLDRNPTKNRG